MPKVSIPKSEKTEKAIKKHPRKKNGGARPGAGRPKGAVSEERRLKNEAEKYFKRRVAENVEPLFNAQIAVAKGCSYLMKRVKYKEGKETRTKLKIVEDPAEIAQYLDGEFDDEPDTYYFITTEKPSTKAIDSLLDRAFGKAAQSVKHSGDEEEPVQIVIRKEDNNDYQL